MTLKNINDVAADVAMGIKQMRKFGFRLVREGSGSQEDPEVQRDALLAACMLLGLESTDDNLRQVPVFTLAQTLLQNAMFPSPA